MLVLICGIGYLCVSDYREKNVLASTDSSNRVLILTIDDDNPSYSDSTQVKNALENGGTIILESTDSDSIDKVFGPFLWNQYGASNAEGYIFTLGALLNYKASRGWTLIQAPTTGLATSFYFTK